MSSNPSYLFRRDVEVVKGARYLNFESQSKSDVATDVAMEMGWEILTVHPVELSEEERGRVFSGIPLALDDFPSNHAPTALQAELMRIIHDRVRD